MRVPASLRWIGLALLGLVIAAAIAIAASQLASQQIGIASESVSAGDSLAPPVTATHRRGREDGGRASEAREERESTAESNTRAKETGPEVTEEAGEAEVPVAPVEPTENPESGPPVTTTPTEPRSDDSGGGAGNDGGGGRDD